LGIDVPAILNVGSKNEVVFSGADLSGLERPFDGVELAEGYACGEKCY